MLKPSKALSFKAFLEDLIDILLSPDYNVEY